MTNDLREYARARQRLENFLSPVEDYVEQAQSLIAELRLKVKALEEARPQGGLSWWSLRNVYPLDIGLRSIVAIYSDGSGADALTYLDGEGWVHGEDASPVQLSDFDWFIAAPADFQPLFMTLTGD